MGKAFETIACYQGTSGSTLAAGTFATGNSGTIRSFGPTAQAFLATLGYDDVTTALPFTIKSPLLADNVQGIEIDPGAAAASELWPVGSLQPLQTQDVLTVSLSTAASTGKALAAIGVYYTDLPGADARLYSWGDIRPLIANIKPLRVAVGSGANTAGIWYDLVITTTENLLVANTDYAVLGISCTAAVAAVGLYGADTSGMRVAAPGGTNNPYSARYFQRLSQETGLPCIPVINAANAGSTYASIVSSAATGAASVVSIMLAELSQRLS